MTQRQSVITSQETRDSSENSEEKRDERDTKEIDRSDLSRNRKHVDDTTKSNSVTSQA